MERCLDEKGKANSHLIETFFIVVHVRYEGQYVERGLGQNRCYQDYILYSRCFSEGAKFCLFSGPSFGHEIKNPRILQPCVPLLSMRYSGHKINNHEKLIL